MNSQSTRHATPYATPQARRWRKTLLVWAAAQALAGAAQAGNIRFELVQIPQLPGLGDRQSVQVTALNNAGQVAGYATNLLDGSSRAFLYVGGQMLALASPPGANEFWQPSAISDPVGALGRVSVVGNVYVGLTSTLSSFSQQADTLRSRLSPAKQFSISGARSIFVSDIDQSSRVVGSYYNNSTSYRQPFVGSLDGSFLTLQHGNGSSTWAAAINNVGLVAGSLALANGTEHAALWSAQTGALRDIGTLGGR